MAMEVQFEPEDHTYRTEGGVIVPSVTQIIRETKLATFDQIRQDVLINKGKLGTYMHKATHLYDVGALDESRLHPKSVGYIDGWKRFVREGDFQALKIEQPMIDRICGMPIGGTPDRVGKLDGVDVILDLKISSAKEKWWGIQDAGYALLECEGKEDFAKLRRRVIVQLRPDGTYRLWEYDELADFDVFQWAVGLIWWRITRGLLTLGKVAAYDPVAPVPEGSVPV